MINPLQKFTENIKKTVVLKAVKYAFDKYNDYKKQRFDFFRNSFLAIAGWIGAVSALIYSLPNGDFLFLCNTAMAFLGVIGGLFIILRYSQYYQIANDTYKYFKTINLDNHDEVLDNFNKVDYSINNAYDDNFFKWEKFNKSLSQEDIQTILSSKLTKEQRDYLRSVIQHTNNITYEHLVELDKLFLKSKEIVEVYQNNAVTNFFKENNFANIKDFLNEEKVELKEIELEAEYRRIL